MYLAIVMDLFSRKIIGWSLDKTMTTTLIENALKQAHASQRPPRGVVFHSDRGSQYTSGQFRKLCEKLHVRRSMGDVGACWDNAVVERFFGSLKHDWILKVVQLTREQMRQDVMNYMRYYNLERLHSYTGYVAPVEFE